MEKKVQIFGYVVCIIVMCVILYTIIDSHLAHKEWSKENKKRTEDLDAKNHECLNEQIETIKHIRKQIDEGNLNVLIVRNDKPGFHLDKKNLKKKK